MERWRRARSPTFTVSCGGCLWEATFASDSLAQDSLTIHFQLVHGVQIDPYQPPE